MHLFYALFEYSLPFWNCWDLINVFTHSSSLEHTHMVGCQEGSQECGSLLIWPQLNMKASPLDYMMALEQERNQKMHRAGSKASYTSYQKAEKKNNKQTTSSWTGFALPWYLSELQSSFHACSIYGISRLLTGHTQSMVWEKGWPITLSLHRQRRLSIESVPPSAWAASK